MPAITMRELLESGVHFGHQTRRWNPKMKPYVFGARNGIYIIDLQKTVDRARNACEFVKSIAAEGKKVLFVGTKAQCKEVIKEEAERCGCPYVAGRWLGGTLTNFQTIETCVDTLNRLEERKNNGLTESLSKKERAALEKEYQRLLANLGGIRNIKDRPGALFVIDPVREHNAVAEARKLHIPVIAITDTNCDPDDIDYVIPGNDDALKSIKLFASSVAQAYLDGLKVYEERARAMGDKRDPNAAENIMARKAATAASSSAPEESGSTTDREGRRVDVEVVRKIVDKTN
jgi:small subunit ribosomal protein S2